MMAMLSIEWMYYWKCITHYYRDEDGILENMDGSYKYRQHA